MTDDLENSALLTADVNHSLQKCPLTPRVSDLRPWATSSPLPVFANKVLSEHSTPVCSPTVCGCDGRVGSFNRKRLAPEANNTYCLELYRESSPPLLQEKTRREEMTDISAEFGSI